jgi:hypothetical protein
LTCNLWFFCLDHTYSRFPVGIRIFLKLHIIIILRFFIILWRINIKGYWLRFRIQGIFFLWIFFKLLKTLFWGKFFNMLHIDLIISKELIFVILIIFIRLRILGLFISLEDRLHIHFVLIKYLYYIIC